MQYEVSRSAVQYHLVCSVMQCGAVSCSVQCHAVWWRVSYDGVLCSVVRVSDWCWAANSQHATKNESLQP